MSKKKKRPQRPALVVADAEGNIFDVPDVEMAVRSGRRCLLPAPDELIPLPKGSRLFTMPGRIPVGWDRSVGEYIAFEEWQAVAAFPPPGYARLFLPAAELVDSSQLLPLWTYTAVGWRDGQFWITARQVDKNVFWNPASFDDRELIPLIEERLARYPNNRLWEHLSRCAIDYHCFAAKNSFYRRWELPLPTSPGCNSRCVGCLSHQPADSFEASHERITFVPTPEEIVEVVLPHVEQVEEAIVSFGQGCEGDPILQTETIVEALRRIRTKTERGTFNMNTNASRPECIERLAQAGLDSLRVSLNSASEVFYDRYYRPANYQFGDVIESIRVARSYGLFVCLNLLMFPGLTDLPGETDALIELVGSTEVDLIQMRNLSIDPDVYVETVGLTEEPGIGIPAWMQRLQEAHPHLRFGYFNRPRQRFQTGGLSA